MGALSTDPQVIVYFQGIGGFFSKGALRESRVFSGPLPGRKSRGWQTLPVFSGLVGDIDCTVGHEFAPELLCLAGVRPFDMSTDLRYAIISRTHLPRRLPGDKTSQVKNRMLLYSLSGCRSGHGV